MHHGWIRKMQTKWSFIHPASGTWTFAISEAFLKPSASSRLELTEQEMMVLLRYLKRIRILNVRLGTAGNVSREHLFYFCHQHNLRVRITYGEKSLWIKGRTVHKYTTILEKGNTASALC